MRDITVVIHYWNNISNALYFSVTAEKIYITVTHYKSSMLPPTLVSMAQLPSSSEMLFYRIKYVLDIKDHITN